MATQASDRWTQRLAWPRPDVRLLLGAALVVVAIVGGLAFWSEARVTVPVVVAARPLTPGDTIGADDLALAEARLEEPLAALALGPEQRAGLIGATVMAPIPAGGLVMPTAVGGGPLIGPDEVGVTVPIPTDTVFPQLRRGDRVAVLGTSEPGRPTSLTAVLLDRATVFDVATEPRLSLGGGDASGGAITSVTLVVPRSAAADLAHAIANGSVTLVLAGAERTP